MVRHPTTTSAGNVRISARAKRRVDNSIFESEFDLGFYSG